jgi:hypothetical protein
MLLTVTMLLLVASALPLMNQAGRTLSAYEKLAGTLDTELKPTLTELKEVMDGVNDLRLQTAKRVNEVGSGVVGTIETVKHGAKAGSSVWTAGLMAGVKAYFAGNPTEDHNKIAKDSQMKRISQSEGERNVTVDA